MVCSSSSWSRRPLTPHPTELVAAAAWGGSCALLAGELGLGEDETGPRSRRAGPGPAGLPSGRTFSGRLPQSVVCLASQSRQRVAVATSPEAAAV